ncbi:MAG: phage holin family protein [Verrucomicrobiota bacterium]
MNILVRWLLTMLSVWVAAYFLDGITYDGWQALAIAALVLGILNAIIKPVLTLLSLPLLLLTLGLFLLVINAVILKLTALLVPGFAVSGFWTAVGGAVIISIVNLFTGNSNVKKKANVSVKTNINRAPRDKTPKPPAGKGPVIDI